MIDVVASHIVNIVQSLLRSDPSAHYQWELQSLEEILAVAGVTISICDHRPLRQSLARFINRDVDGCNPILHALLGKLKCNPQDLSSTGRLMRQVLSNGDKI